jgi:hypothetical protein
MAARMSKVVTGVIGLKMMPSLCYIGLKPDQGQAGHVEKASNRLDPKPPGCFIWLLFGLIIFREWILQPFCQGARADLERLQQHP